MLRYVLIVALLVSSACAGNKPPSTLSPEAVRAFYAKTVILDLDRVESVAHAAHQTTPPLISAKDDLAVVQWHEVAITIAHDAKAGWQSALNASILGLQKALPPATWTLIAPYVQLALSIIKAVQS